MKTQKKTVKKVAKKKATKEKAPVKKMQAPEAVDVSHRLGITNVLLKKIQKYYYFSGDNYAVREHKLNNEVLEDAEEKNAAYDLLKASNDSLLLIQANGYGANDFFLNDIISANDKFLNLK